jgi:hypothetical protein
MGITTMDRLNFAYHAMQIAPHVSDQRLINATVVLTLNSSCPTKPNATIHVLITVLITLQEWCVRLATQIAYIALTKLIALNAIRDIICSNLIGSVMLCVRMDFGKIHYSSFARSVRLDARLVVQTFFALTVLIVIISMSR